MVARASAAHLVMKIELRSGRDATEWMQQGLASLLDWLILTTDDAY